MAYNPNMYNTYGQMYGNSYGQQMYPQSMQGIQPQSYGQAPAVKGEIEWVDGEVGAKAYQVPAGMTKPVALWDTNDTVIYLKSVNQYGIPNPIQKIHYRMEEMVPKYMGQDQAKLESGDAEPSTDMSEYVKKSDLEKMKQDLMDTIGSMGTSGTGVRKGSSKGETA